LEQAQHERRKLPLEALLCFLVAIVGSMDHDRINEKNCSFLVRMRIFGDMPDTVDNMFYCEAREKILCGGLGG